MSIQSNINQLLGMSARVAGGVKVYSKLKGIEKGVQSIADMESEAKAAANEADVQAAQTDKQYIQQVEQYTKDQKNWFGERTLSPFEESIDKAIKAGQDRLATKLGAIRGRDGAYDGQLSALHTMREAGMSMRQAKHYAYEFNKGRDQSNLITKEDIK